MNASLAPVSELTPAGPNRRQRGIRVPQLLLSLLVVAVFALLAVWWQASTTSRTPVLALANDVEVGVPLTRADLTEVYINTDVPTVHEPVEFLELFVGVSPVADLEAGTLITDAMFRSSSALEANEALVGVRVSGDEAPSGIAIGDQVQVLVEAGDDEVGGVTVLAPDAIVEAVTPTRDGTQVALRLRMGIEQAQLTQLAAEDVVVIEVEVPGPPSWSVGSPTQPDEEDGS